jgi:hypothetical protein
MALVSRMITQGRLSTPLRTGRDDRGDGDGIGGGVAVKRERSLHFGRDDDYGARCPAAWRTLC